jgi:hypothetical protein
MQQDNYLNSQNHRAVADETGSSFDPRYLAAKKTIDDRALNHHVWETLRQALPQTTCGGPANILEIGAGIGTMLERIVDRELLTGPATYVATDSDPNQLRAARQYLSQWAKERGHILSWPGEHRGRLRTAKADVFLVLELASAEELAADRPDSPGLFHLVIAHAVLDLIDFPVLLPRLLSRLTNNGLAYCTCNFDGETVFLPECEGEEEIIKCYHASMEARQTGASHTGRRLLTLLQRPGLELMAAGSSDWVIHPRDRCYSTDETFFLHAILTTVTRELTRKKSPPANLDAWSRARHRQVETGELSFLARHLDLLARRLPALP